MDNTFRPLTLKDLQVAEATERNQNTVRSYAPQGTREERYQALTRGIEANQRAIDASQPTSGMDWGVGLLSGLVGVGQAGQAIADFGLVNSPQTQLLGSILKASAHLSGNENVEAIAKPFNQNGAFSKAFSENVVDLQGVKGNVNALYSDGQKRQNAAIDAGFNTIDEQLAFENDWINQLDNAQNELIKRGGTEADLNQLQEDWKAAYTANAGQIQDRVQMSLDKSLGENASALGNSFMQIYHNPRVAGLAVAESVPSLIAGGAIGRGLAMAAPRLGGAIAGGVGEGTVMAGSALENMRNENADKLLTDRQVLTGLGIGALGGAIGVAGGKIANRLGLDDVDSSIAGAPSPTKLNPLRIPLSTAQEGLEEAVQTSMETIGQNYATDKDLFDGLAQNVAIGTVAGGIMGGGNNILATAPEAIEATAEGVKKVKDKITGDDLTFDEYLAEDTFDPVKAVNSQMKVMNSADATDEMKATAQSNLDSVIERATETYNAVRETKEAELLGFEQELAKTHKQITAIGNQLDSGNVSEEMLPRMQRVQQTLQETIPQLETTIATKQSELDDLVVKHESALQMMDSLSNPEAVTADSTVQNVQNFAQGTESTPEQSSGSASTTEAPTGGVKDAEGVADSAVKDVLNNPAVFTPEQLQAMYEIENTPFSPNQEGLLRQIGDTKQKLNEYKSMDKVTQGITEGTDGYRGLDSYMNKMGEAIRNKWGRVQENILREVDKFHTNYANKDFAVSKAYEMATGKSPIAPVGEGMAAPKVFTTEDGKKYFQVYKDQTDGTWRINTGEVTINPEDRAKYGALNIHKGSGKLVNQIATETGLITSTQATLVEMQRQAEVLAQKKQAQATGTGNTSTTPASTPTGKGKGVTPTPTSTPSVKLPKHPNVSEAIREKDQTKSNKATQYIGIGKEGSSTALYAEAWGDRANSGEYTAEDTVFISMNGNPSKGVSLKNSPELVGLIKKAMGAGATLITDNKEYREGSKYNQGERDLAEFLTKNGYEEQNGSGTWVRKQEAQTPKTPMSIEDELDAAIEESLNKRKEIIESSAEPTPTSTPSTPTPKTIKGNTSNEGTVEPESPVKDVVSHLDNYPEQANKPLDQWDHNDFAAVGMSQRYTGGEGTKLSLKEESQANGLIAKMIPKIIKRGVEAGKSTSEVMQEVYALADKDYAIGQSGVASLEALIEREHGDKGKGKPQQKKAISEPETQEARVERPEHILREDVRFNPNKLFLFGDNDTRKGMGGQANSMRGEPNAVGIRTKAAPSMNEGSFWADDTYEENIRKIDEDFKAAFEFEGTVVIPKAGLGTGLSKLKTSAPKTLAHIEMRIAELEAGKPMSKVEVGAQSNEDSDSDPRADVADTEEVEVSENEKQLGYLGKLIDDPDILQEQQKKPESLKEKRESFEEELAMLEEAWQLGEDENATSPDPSESIEEDEPHGEVMDDVEEDEEDSPEITSEGSLSVFDGIDAKARKAEGKKPFKDRNLVKAGLFQKVKKSVYAPFVHTADFATKFLKTPDNFVAVAKKILKRDLNSHETDSLTDFASLFLMQKDGKNFTDFVNERLAPMADGWAHQDPSMMMAQEIDGDFQLEENITSAMLLGAFTWLMENVNSPPHTNEGLNTRILHIEKDTKIYPNALLNSMRDKTEFGPAATAIGAKISKSLGLQAFGGTDASLLPRLEAALGNRALYAMQDMGWINLSTLTKAQFESMKPKRLQKPVPDQTKGQKQNTYIAITQSRQLRKNLKDAGRTHSQSGAVVTEVFFGKSNIRYPSLAEPTKLIRENIKGTTASIPPEEEARLLEGQKAENRVRSEIANPIMNLLQNHYKEFYDLMGLTLDKNVIAANTHTALVDNELARREGYVRDLEGAMDYIQSVLTNEDGTTKPFYNEYVVYVNQRFGPNSNVLNTQASQVHRALTGPSELKTEGVPSNALSSVEGMTEAMFDVDADGNQTPNSFGLFLMAIAEGLEEIGLSFESGDYQGDTVDKVGPADYLPAFVNWIAMPQTQKVLDALIEVKQATGTLNEGVLSAIKENFVDPDGKPVAMDFPALTALMYLADAKVAHTKGEKTFTTYARASSDGKTSGSAIAFALAGVMTEELSNGFGFITKSEEAKGVSNQFEYNRNYGGDIYFHIVKTLAKNWGGLDNNLATLFDGEMEQPLIKALDKVFGVFKGRKKGKTLGTPSAYSAGIRSLIDNNTVENIEAVFAKFTEFANNGDLTSAQSYFEQLNLMVAEYNSLYAHGLKDSKQIFDLDVANVAEAGWDIFTPEAQKVIKTRVLLKTGKVEAPTSLKDLETIALALGAQQSKGKHKLGAEKLIVQALAKDKAQKVAPITVPTSTKNLLSYRLPTPALEAIAHMSDELHGAAIRQTLTEVYGSFIEVRNVVNASAAVAFTLYQERRDALIAERVKLKQEAGLLSSDPNGDVAEGLSSKELAEIDAELKPHQPNLGTAMSQMDEDTRVDAGLKMAKTGVQHSKEKGYEKASPTLKGLKGSANTGISRRVDSSPGVLGSVLPILAMDANVASKIVSIYPAENMHDSNYLKYPLVAKMAQEQNRTLFDGLVNYDMHLETAEMVVRAFEELADPNLSEEFSEAFSKLANALDIPKGVAIEDVLDVLIEDRRRIENMKLDGLANISVVHNYGGWGGELKLTDADYQAIEAKRKKVNARAKALSDRVSSLGKAVRTETATPEEIFEQDQVAEVMTPHRGKAVSADVVIDALLNHPTILQGNAAYAPLLEAIKKVMPSGLTINYFNTKAVPQHVVGKHMLQREGIRGWFNEKANQINLVEGQVTPEVLIHELLHAAAVPMMKKGAVRDEVAEEAFKRLRKLYNLAQKNFKDRKEYSEALSTIHEFVAYGLTNPAFSKELRTLTVRADERNPRSLRTMFKEFVESIVTLVMGKAKISSANMSAYEALLIDTADILGNEPAPLGNVGTFDGLDDEMHPMITANTEADEQARLKNAREIFDSLDATGVSTEFSTKLGDLMTTLVDKVTSGIDRTHLKEAIQDTLQDENIAQYGFGLSEREAYAVRSIAAVLSTITNSNEMNRHYQEIHKLHAIARKQLTPQDFYQGDWKTATNQDRALAKAQHKALLHSKDGWVNFAAMALGSERFQGILNIQEGASATKVKGFVEKLREAFYAIADWVSGLLTKTTKNQTVHARIQTLANNIAQIDVHYRKRTTSRWEKFGANSIEGMEEKYGKVLRKLIGLGDNKFFRNSRFTPLNTIARLSKINSKKEETDFVSFFKDMRNNANPQQQFGELGNTVNEFVTPDKFTKFMQKLLRQTKEKEKQRALVKETTHNLVNKSFDKEPTDKEHRAMSYAMLRTDLQSLLDGFSLDYIYRFMTQKSARSNAMNKLTQEIMKEPTGNIMMHQVKQLAWAMVSMNPTAGVPANALGIAQGITSPKFNGQLKDVDPALLKKLDQLVTLYALEYTASEHLTAAGKVFKRELDRKEGNGVEVMLRRHQSLVGLASEDFQYNALNQMKGWMPEISDPYKEVITRPTAEKQKLIKEGWKHVAELEKDSADVNAVPTSMFIREGGYQRRLSTTLDLTDSHIKGTLVSDGRWGTTTAVMRKSLNQKIAKQYRGKWEDYDPRADKSTGVFPIFDANGQAHDFAYRMTHNVRDELLGRKHNVGELLGEYAGKEAHKVNTEKTNQGVLDALRSDFEENYKKNPVAYTAIGPQVADPSAQELWRLLPFEAQLYMADIWGMGKPMYVRNDLIHLVFGYKKLSAGNIWNKQKHQQNVAEKVFKSLADHMLGPKAQLRVYQVGRGVSDTVRTMKDFIVIRNLDVLKGNVLANVSLLFAYGVYNPKDIIEHTLVALKSARQYQADTKRLIEAEAMIRMGIDVDKWTVELTKAQDSLSRNHVRTFIEEGMLPSIVGDAELSQDDYSYQTALGKKMSRVTDHIPDMAKATAKQVFMSPGSFLHSTMMEATQLSDFTARYVLYRHLTKKGKSHDEAVTEASAAFINYDLPSSPIVQYLNDIGLFMFTKFYFRFQRVLFTLLKKNPAMVLLQSMALNAFTDLPTVLDPAFWEKGLGFLNGGPLGIFDAALNISTVDVVF